MLREVVARKRAVLGSTPQGVRFEVGSICLIRHRSANTPTLSFTRFTSTLEFELGFKRTRNAAASSALIVKPTAHAPTCIACS